MSEKIFTLTIDTNVYRNAFKNPELVPDHLVNAVVAARKLKEAHDRGSIQITYNAGEGKNKPDEVNTFLKTRGPWILGFEGFSEVGISTVLVSEEVVNLVQEILNPPEVSTNSSNSKKRTMKDFALLVEHVSAGRDIFVSEDWDGHLRHSESLKAHNIRVMSASQVVAELEKQKIL